MRFRIIPLEERIVLDAAGVFDILHAYQFESLHSQLDAIRAVPHTDAVKTVDNSHDKTFTVDANAASTSSGIHVLVISSAIQDPTVLEAAAKDPGHVVFYDPATTSLSQLSQDIASVLHGQQADSIAFVNEGKPGQFSLTQDVSVSMATLQSSAGLQTFWHDVGTMVRDGGHVDLLACDVAANAQGVAAVNDIDHLVDVSGKHIQVDASTDLTGNASSGGNWQLELGGVNVAPIYFDTPALSHWDGTLGNFAVTENGVLTGQLQVLLPSQTVVPQTDVTTTHGVVTVNADGSFNYTPNTNYQGLDSFQYVVNTASRSPGGTNTTATADIYVTVPVAYDLPLPAGVQVDNLLGNIASVNGITYFLATDFPISTQPQIWETDGNLNGTSIVTNFLGNPAIPAIISNLTAFNGALYFSVDTGLFGSASGQLYEISGTTLTTVGPAFESVGSSGENLDDRGEASAPFFTENGLLYFVGQTASLGEQVYTTDGTQAGTSSTPLTDFNPGVLSIISGFTVVNPSAATPLVVFSAEDGFGDGQQLWVTDGTQAGTSLLTDLNTANGGINPGSPNLTSSLSYLGSQTETALANQTEIVSLGDFAVFTVNMGTSSAPDMQVWRTDGTAAGTSEIMDFGNEALFSMAPVNGQAIFSTLNGFLGLVWSTDGTAANTTPIAAGVDIGGNVSFNNELYFIGANSAGTNTSLYATDGTAAGTTLVSGSQVFTIPDNVALGVIGNSLFFSANDGVNGTQLWESNGSSVVLASDIAPGSASDPQNFTSNGQALIFDAINTGAGGLWTVGNSIQLNDQSYVAADDSTLSVNATNGLLNGAQDVNGEPLQVTPESNVATANGSVTINADGSFSYTPDAGYLGPDSFSYQVNNIDGTVRTGYASLNVEFSNQAPTFTLPDTSTLVVENTGAHTATQFATNIADGAGDPAGQTLTFVVSGDSNPALFSVAPSIDSNGTLTYTLASGTGAATISVTLNDGVSTSPAQDFTITATPPAAAYDLPLPAGVQVDNAPGMMASVNRITYFVATDSNDSSHGTQPQIWETDGNLNGTSVVTNLPAGSSIGDLTAFKGDLYFSVDSGTSGQLDEISLTTAVDGISVPTVTVASGAFIQIGASSVFGGTELQDAPFFTENGLLYFVGQTIPLGTQVYVTTGTIAGGAAGIEVLTDFNEENSVIGNFTMLNPTAVLFSAGDLDGQQLWVTDVTQGIGALRLTDLNTANQGINPGSPFVGSNLSYLGSQIDSTLENQTEIVSLGNFAVFAANMGTSTAPDMQLWRTDGTAAGTSEIMDFGNVSLFSMAAVNGKAIFSTFNGGETGEMWISDGTAAGTSQIVTGGPIIDLGNVSFNNALYFIGDNTGDNTGNGFGLYATDGTAITESIDGFNFTFVLATDVSAGTTFFTPSNVSLGVIGNSLFFSANDGLGDGTQLWHSYGQYSGVELAKDISPAGTNSAPANFTSNGQALLFDVSNTTDGGLWTAGNSIQLNDQSYIAPENGTLSENAANGLLNGAQDVNGEALQVTPETSATANGSVTINADGSFSYTPDAGYLGPNIFSYQVTNTDGTVRIATASLNVEFSNQAPTFSLPNPDTAAFENSGAQGVANFATNIADGVGDPAGQPLTFVVSGDSNPALFSVAPSIDSSGNLTYTLASGEIGAATISVSLNDGISTSAVQEFTITADRTPVAYDLPLPAGVQVLSSVSVDGITFSEPMTSVNGITYFLATDPAHANPQIWETDGNLNGTSIVTNFPGGSIIGDLTAFNGALYFSVDSGIMGSASGQLYELSGTTVTAIGGAFGSIGNSGINASTGNIISESAPFFTENGLLYFVGETSALGAQVYTTDGTTTISSPLTDFNPSVLSKISGFTVVNNPTEGPLVIFSANDGVDGQQLWVTNGTTSSMLTDLNTANGGIDPGSTGFPLSAASSLSGINLLQIDIASLGNSAVFTANVGTASAPDMQLWTTDGTAANTSEIMDFSNNLIISMTAVGNGNAIFSSTFGPSLAVWSTDGTATGTSIIANGVVDYGNASFNNEIYFIGLGTSAPTSLYATDGTAAGTVSVSPAGMFTFNFFSDAPPSLAAIGNSLFFSANDGAGDGNQLWASNGSSVVLVSDISPSGTDSNPQNFTNNGQALIFDVINTTDGGLWTAGNSIQLNDQSYIAPENGTLSENAANGLLNGAQDVNGEALQVTPESNVATANGSVTINADGSFSYTPDAGYLGPDSFSYQVTNTDGTVRTGYASLNVDAAPVANNDSYTVVGSLAANTSILANDTDVNGLAFTPSVVSGPAHGTLTLNADGTFTYASTGGYVGPDSFTYKDTDAGGSSNVATVSLTVDQAPIATNDAYSVGENGVLNQAAPGVLANDTDPQSVALTPTLISSPSHGSLTLNADGSFNYTPAANYFGPDSFTYTAADGIQDSNGVVHSSNVATVNITVSEAAPVANNDSYTVVGSLAANTSILANDTDINGLTFTPSVVSGPAHGTLTLNADGTFTYASTGGYVGPDSFTYKDTDAGGSSNVATVSLTVDQAPIAVNDAYSVGENGVLNQAAPGVLANDTDPQSVALTPTLISSPSHGSLTLNADGSFNYTPATNYFGLDSFTYTAADGIQDSNGVVHSSNLATVNITVGEAAPVANNDSYTVVGSLAANTSILANDTDINGLAFTPSVVSGPAHGTLTLNADGTFTYASTGGYVGPDSFTYKDTDAGGSSNVATVSLTVDQAPIATNDAYSVGENGVLNQAAPGVLANDTDPQSVALTPTLISSPSHGSLTLNADGSFNYTPAANYFGPDSFTYTAADGIQDSNGVVHSSNVATVNITVSEAAPVANNDSYTVVGSLAANTSILANDTDINGLTFTPSVVSGPAHGTLTLNADGTFTYASTGGYVGPDSFTYKDTDAGGSSNVATVSLTVDQAPIAVNDAYSVGENGVLNQAAPGVLANDTDPQSVALTPTLISSPSHGSLTLNADGSFNYTPATNYFGLDSFTYTAADGIQDSNGVVHSSNLATVNITVGEAAPVANNDSYTVVGSLAANTSILANDTDINGLAFTPSVVSGPAHGTLTINADGTFTYASTGGYVGPDSFTYKDTNGGGSSNIATVSLTVDQAPIAVNDAYSVGENGVLNQAAPGVLANDTDPQSVALTPTLISSPSHGSLTLNADGSFNYTPATNYFGPDSFTYTAADGIQDSNGVVHSSNLATVNITVSEAAPVANNDSYTVVGSLAANTSILANDTDVNGLTFTPSVVSGPAHGTLTLNADGTFTYASTGGYVGPDSFTYKDTNGGGSSNIATVSLTVDQAPIAANDMYSVNENGVLNQAAPGVLANDTDPQGDTLTSSLISSPSHGSLTLNADGSFIYTPAANYFGPDSFTYKVADGIQDSNGVVHSSNVATVNIAVGETAPVANNDSYTVVGSLAANTSILANDTDPNDLTLTPSIVTEPAHGTLTLNADGTFTYVSTGGYVGPDSFTYKDTDAGGSSNVATVSLTVDQAPITTNDAYSVGENGVLNQAAPGVLANDTDPQGDSLSSTLVSGPSHGTLTLNADGSFIYTPAANYFGPDSFTYTAADGIQDSNGVVHSSNLATVNITVSEAAPVANNDSYTVVGSLAANTSILANDTDINGLTFTPSVVTGPAHGTLTLNADGTFTYASTGGYVGPDSFTYKDTDAGGSSNIATVSLTVDQAPTAVNDAYSVNENGSLNQAAPGVLVNDTDPQGDALTTTLISSPSHGTLTLNPDGSFIYTPNANYFGPDSFTYKVADGIQDSNGVVHSSNVATVNIAVGEAAPVANNDSYTVVGSLAANTSILANDTDVNGLAFTPSVVTGPAHGTLTLNANGTFTYVSTGGYVGPDSFTYKDTNGGGSSNVATVSLTVDQAPTAVNDAYSVGENGSLNQAAPGVLVNDTDPQSVALTPTLISSPSHGSLTLNPDGSFIYTPNANYFGPDSFTYKVADGIQDSNGVVHSSNVATVNIAVGEAAPVANNDSYTVVGSLAANTSILANDTDVNGLAFTPSVVTGPAHGTLTLNANGTFTYVSTGGYVGPDSFTYKDTNGGGSSNVATVSLTVDQAPTAVNDAYSVGENGSLNQAAPGVLVNDTDPQSVALTPTLISSPSHGSLTLNPNGSFSYTPAANYSGPDSFTYTVADGIHDSNGVVHSSNVATVNITVNFVNQAPSFTIPAAAPTVPENSGAQTDTNFATNISVGAGDPPSETVHFNVISDSNSSLFSVAPTISPSGTLTYTPGANETGTATITVDAQNSGGTANGGNDTSATKSFTITIQSNGAPVAHNDAYNDFYLLSPASLSVAAPGVLANDTDPNGLSLTAQLLTGPSHGTLHLNANGSFTYAPTLSYLVAHPSFVDTFTYRDTDGTATSNAATVSITVDPIPVIANIPINPTFIEGQSPVILSPDSLAVHPTGFTGSYLTVTMAGNGTSTDILSILPGNQVTLSGVNVFYKGIDIGAYSGGTNSTALVITFNSNATAVSVSEVMDQLAFSTTSHSTLNRTVQFQLTDNVGDRSNTLTTTVRVVDEPPTIGATSTTLNLATHTASHIGTLSGLNVTDADANGIFTVSLQVQKGTLNFSSLSGLNLQFLNGTPGSSGMIEFQGSLANVNTALSRLIYTSNTGYTGSDQLSISIFDSEGNIIVDQDQDSIFLHITK